MILLRTNSKKLSISLHTINSIEEDSFGNIVELELVSSFFAPDCRIRNFMNLESFVDITSLRSLKPVSTIDCPKAVLSITGPRNFTFYNEGWSFSEDKSKDSIKILKTEIKQIEF